jgi:RNA-directed DNA polymerase
VLDRFIQQAVMQVLQSRWDRTFSEHSHGFRRVARRIRRWPRRSSISPQATAGWWTSILEKFFDRVNHDKLMAA